MPLTLAAAINTLRKEAEQERSYGNLQSSLSTLATSSCECTECQKRNYGNTIPADFEGLIVELSCLSETVGVTYEQLFPPEDPLSRVIETAAAPVTPPRRDSPGVAPVILDRIYRTLIDEQS